VTRIGRLRLLRDRVTDALRKWKFATDSLLEETGFETPVPFLCRLWRGGQSQCPHEPLRSARDAHGSPERLRQPFRSRWDREFESVFLQRRSLHLRHRAGLREEVGPGSRQAVELDHKKREAILHKCSSSSTSGRSLRRSGNWPSSTGVGPRVGESAFGKIARFPYAAPYEDITLKAS
jgi:hypothetical protein